MAGTFDKYALFPKRHFLITPSDTVDLPQESLVYCGGAGTVSAVDDMGAALSYTVAAGEILPVIVQRVNATGTTATPLYGLI